MNVGRGTRKKSDRDQSDRGQSVDCGFYIGSMIGLDVVGGEAVTHRIP